MALKFSDCTRPVAPDADYPYGSVKDNPGGTQVDKALVEDTLQAFRRLADDAGITLNSLPDNETNGWQFAQAINTLISNPVSAWAASLNTPTGTFLPVKLSGLQITGTTTLTVTAGYLFYDGRLVYCAGGTVDNSTSGMTPGMLVGDLDAMPVGDLASISSSTIENSGRFKLSSFVTLNSQNGFDSFTASISTINTQVALGSWVTISPTGSGWAAAVLNPCRYRIDGMGRVYLQGQFYAAASGAASDIFVMPTGFRPSRETYYLVYAQGVTNNIGYLRIFTDGTIQFSPTTTGSTYVDIGSIMYLTT